MPPIPFLENNKNIKKSITKFMKIRKNLIIPNSKNRNTKIII